MLGPQLGAGCVVVSGYESRACVCDMDGLDCVMEDDREKEGKSKKRLSICKGQRESERYMCGEENLHTDTVPASLSSRRRGLLSRRVHRSAKVRGNSGLSSVRPSCSAMAIERRRSGEYVCACRSA